MSLVLRLRVFVFFFEEEHINAGSGHASCSISSTFLAARYGGAHLVAERNGVEGIYESCNHPMFQVNTVEH
jgi:hypothetical protein